MRRLPLQKWTEAHARSPAPSHVVLEVPARVHIPTTEERPTHAAADAMVVRGGFQMNEFPSGSGHWALPVPVGIDLKLVA